MPRTTMGDPIIFNCVILSCLLVGAVLSQPETFTTDENTATMSTSTSTTTSSTSSSTSTTTSRPTTNSSSNAYCFRFTWLGPEYDASAEIDGASCTDLLGTYTETPCTRPLVATRNGYLPDMNKLWEEYKASPTDIACRLTAGNVCVKYIHRYNNQYQNITYMCSKVTIVGEGATTSGCYKQNLDGFELETCVCRSRVGEMPCNSAPTLLHISSWIGLLVVSALIAVVFNTQV